MQQVNLYTDGACSGNPGPGGWAYLLLYQGHIKKDWGSSPITTNNRMELSAICYGLSRLKRNCEVNIYSDSQYICNAFNQNWIGSWAKNGWITSKKTSVKNQDKWLELLEYSKCNELNFIWVKGHSNNEYNNEVDKLAVEACRNQLNSTLDDNYINHRIQSLDIDIYVDDIL